MNQQFRVRLVDYRPVDIWVIFGMMSMVFVFPFLLMPLLPRLPFPVFIGWLGVMFFSIWWYARSRVCETQITVLVDRLMIAGLAPGRPAEVVFANVVSYRYMVTRGGDVVRFKLADGSRLKVIANDLFGKTGDFTGMVKSLMQAAEQYHLEHPSTMTRDTSIF